MNRALKFGTLTLFQSKKRGGITRFFGDGDCLASRSFTKKKIHMFKSWKWFQKRWSWYHVTPFKARSIPAIFRWFILPICSSRATSPYLKKIRKSPPSKAKISEGKHMPFCSKITYGQWTNPRSSYLGTSLDRINADSLSHWLTHQAPNKGRFFHKISEQHIHILVTWTPKYRPATFLAEPTAAVSESILTVFLF